MKVWKHITNTNNTGQSFTLKMLSYSDYLDYWMKEHIAK